MIGGPTYDQAAGRCDYFVCVPNFVRRFWGVESVGRDEVAKPDLGPEKPSVYVLHVLQSGN